LSNRDAPFGRDAGFALPPLEPRRFTDTQFGGDVIDELPCESGVHALCIGHIVQAVKPTVSKDFWTGRRHTFAMPAMSEEAAFNEALCARVHRLRNDRGWTSQQMATALGVPPDRYRKYEYRSPMPHYLVERFALIVGRDVEYILTGKSAPSRQMAEKAKKLA
jgi:hypothetical protein